MGNTCAAQPRARLAGLRGARGGAAAAEAAALRPYWLGLCVEAVLAVRARRTTVEK